MSFIDIPYVPNGKIDKNSVPPDEANKYFSSAEWNSVCSSLLDLRTHSLNGYLGLSESASAPTGVTGLSTTKLWGKTDGNLVYTRSGTANLVAAGPVTTKGDILVFNGTNWVRLAAGTNNYVLTADSAQASGLKWAAGGGGGSLTVTAGSGLSGGGSVSFGGSVSLDIGAGTGITVNADDIAINQSFVPTWTGSHTFSHATAPIISAKIGPASGQQHAIPAVTSDTLALLNATQTLASKTFTSPIISSGLTASGSASNDFSGSTGTFKTSTGACTFGGSSNTFSNPLDSATSLTLKSTAADGASAVAGIIDTSTTWSNAGAKILSLRTNNSEQAYVKSNGEITSKGIFPVSNNNYNCGNSSLRWGYVAAYVYSGAQVDSSASGAITMYSTSGETYKLTATGNITSLTLDQGTFGQIMTLVFIQDAGGTSTWPSTISGVKLVGGSFTKSTGAGQIDTLTVRFGGLFGGVAYWVEIGRAMNIS